MLGRNSVGVQAAKLFSEQGAEILNSHGVTAGNFVQSRSRENQILSFEQVWTRM